jgi:hypothetical protein
MIIVKVLNRHDNGSRFLLGCIESDSKGLSGLGTMILGCLVPELWLEKQRN